MHIDHDRAFFDHLSRHWFGRRGVVCFVGEEKFDGRIFLCESLGGFIDCRAPWLLGRPGLHNNANLCLGSQRTGCGADDAESGQRE